jgi:hypothetical protein
MKISKGDDYASTYLVFRMVFFFLILWYFKKMAPDEGGGVEDGRAQ